MKLLSVAGLALLLALAAACSPADDRPAAPDSPPSTIAPAPLATVPQGAPAPEPAGSPDVSPPAASAEAAPAAPAAAVIVDVRTPEEYAAGHVEGAVLIPHDQMAQRWQELQAYRDQPVLLYCRSGRRSSIALEVLRSQGFTRLENGGGIAALAARGLTVTRD